jgi:hypothetical protein
VHRLIPYDKLPFRVYAQHEMSDRCAPCVWHIYIHHTLIVRAAYELSGKAVQLLTVDAIRVMASNDTSIFGHVYGLLRAIGHKCKYLIDDDCTSHRYDRHHSGIASPGLEVQ